MFALFPVQETQPVAESPDRMPARIATGTIAAATAAPLAFTTCHFAPSPLPFATATATAICHWHHYHLPLAPLPPWPLPLPLPLPLPRASGTNEGASVGGRASNREATNTVGGRGNDEDDDEDEDADDGERSGNEDEEDDDAADDDDDGEDAWCVLPWALPLSLGCRCGD